MMYAQCADCQKRVRALLIRVCSECGGEKLMWNELPAAPRTFELDRSERKAMSKSWSFFTSVVLTVLLIPAILAAWLFEKIDELIN